MSKKRLVWMLLLTILGLSAFVYGLWQANHGKWSEGCFWLIISMSAENSFNRMIDEEKGRERGKVV